MAGFTHLIWMGKAPSVRSVANAHRLAGLFMDGLGVYDDLAPEDQPYLPLLWVDQSAQSAMLAQGAVSIALASWGDVPAALRGAATQALGEHAACCRWFKICLLERVCFLPFLLYEDMRVHLGAPWLDLADVVVHYERLWAQQEGQALLRSLVQGAGIDSSLASVLHNISVQDVNASLSWLTEHARAQWGQHGLMCLASDLLRLQVLMLLPGAYVDLGDAAGLMLRLPTRRLVGAEWCEFCGHQTVAIENDVIFCHSPSLMKSITLGVYLWTTQTLRGIVRRQSGELAAQGTTLELLQRALPQIDARMPVAPDMALLFAPPYTTLANYVCRAYGGQPFFEGAESLNVFFQVRQGRELLIDRVGGFTGYQKFAFYLAPHSKHQWMACAASFGLDSYAPQLGWKSYGFGVVDTLVHNAKMIKAQHALSACLRLELNQLAKDLGVEGEQFLRIAFFCEQVFNWGSLSHQDPSKRALYASKTLAAAQALGG